MAIYGAYVCIRDVGIYVSYTGMWVMGIYVPYVGITIVYVCFVCWYYVGW